MNNLKNIFGLHVSRNVRSKSNQGIDRGENILKKKYLRSKSLKNIKSDPFLKAPKYEDKESNLIKASNKTKTIYGGLKKSSSLERSNSLDGLSHINNGHINQVAGFKNSMCSQFNRVNNEEMENSLKTNEIKKQNLLNQEARSYAKLIANYSRAMENESIYTKSFDQNYGRSSVSISDSPFNSLVPPLSKMKKKTVKSGSILNTRNSSSQESSPKNRRIIQSADKNGRTSFYSTDSGTFKEIVKCEDMSVQNTKTYENEKDSEFKLDVKDTLDSVTARADWLENVIKAHKELKMRNMIQNNYVSKAQEEKLNVNRKKDQDNTSKTDNSKSDPMLEIDACPIESSFKPVIDSYAVSEILNQKNSVELRTRTNPVNMVKIPNSENTDYRKVQKSKFEKKANVEKEVKKENPGKSKLESKGEGNFNSSENDSSSVINFQINGKSSEFVKNGSIKVVKSQEKIEIRIPISALFAERENEGEQIHKLEKSGSTLSLQILAKIETADRKELENQEKVAPEKEIISVSENVKSEGCLRQDLKFSKEDQKKENELNLKFERNAPVKKVTLETVSVDVKKAISKNSETTKECVKELSVKEKIDDNLTKEINAKNAAEANRAKIRRRKKATTMISRVIENELEKQNEQVLKDKKVTTALTTETKKNQSEAVKPETKRLDQESRTIDKVTKKMDAVIDQNVAKKLNDNVTPADKKGASPPVLLKTKLKNHTEKVSLKKGIDATSASTGKYSATKEQTGPSKMHLTAKSHIMEQRQRMTNIDSQLVSKGPVKTQIESPKKTTFETVKAKRDLKKDVPKELKPLEKKKDGTLIDYGLKVPTRKNKEQPIKATIKEILNVREKNLDVLKSTQIPPQRKEVISIKTESLQNESSVHGFTNNDFNFDPRAKLVDFKMVLKLQDFEENHIFSGSSCHLQSKSNERTGALRSTPRSERKDTTMKSDNKGSHGKTTGSSMITDRGMVAVKIDDCSRNQSTGKINSMKKNCSKLFSKTSQCNGSKSAGHVERLMNISTNKSYSEKSNVSFSKKSSSAMKDRLQRPEKEILYSNWLQKYNNLKIIVTD